MEAANLQTKSRELSCPWTTWTTWTTWTVLRAQSHQRFTAAQSLQPGIPDPKLENSSTSCWQSRHKLYPCFRMFQVEIAGNHAFSYLLCSWNWFLPWIALALLAIPLAQGLRRDAGKVESAWCLEAACEGCCGLPGFIPVRHCVLCHSWKVAYRHADHDRKLLLP